MSVPQRLALIGLSAFERRTLESFFRLDAGRPGFEIVDDLPDCDWIIADGERADTLRQVRRLDRLEDTLLVGPPVTAGEDTPRCAARLPRPIDALALRRALDELVARRQARQQRPGALLRLPPSPGHQRQAALADREVHDFHASSGFSNTVLAEGDLRLERILVVSASPAECRLLRDTLMPLGYRVHLSRRAGEAERMTALAGYGFVFLGVGQGGPAGFQLGRRIKRQAVPGGGSMPVVVALAPRGSAIERIRATFAGCDAFLTTPLDEQELLHLLARHDRTFERVFQPTALMTPLELRA